MENFNLSLNDLKLIWEMVEYAGMIAINTLFYVLTIKVLLEKFGINLNLTGKLASKFKGYSYPKQTDFNSQVARWGCAFMVACWAKNHPKHKIQEFIDTLGSPWYNHATKPCYMDKKEYELVLGGWPIGNEYVFIGNLDEVKQHLRDNKADNGCYRLTIDTSKKTGIAGSEHYCGLKMKNNGADFEKDFKFYNPDDSIDSSVFTEIRRLT